jgi:hypothetical protein
MKMPSDPNSGNGAGAFSALAAQRIAGGSGKHCECVGFGQSL